MDRRLTTILAADVVGYSRLMGVDEAATLAALKGHYADLIKPKAAQYGGRTIKLMGDGILMEFSSVVDAVTFAVEVQTAMRERNSGIPEDQQIIYRVGINLGDIIVEDDDIFGDGVNVAARLEGLAEPGGICVRRNVRNQVRDKLDLGFEDLGEVEVKNIVRPVRVFRVILDDRASALSTPVVAQLEGGDSNRWRIVAMACAVAVILVGGLAWWQPWRPGDGSAELGPRPDLTDKPSIAVLPFANMSGDPEQEYFADGLTDDLITDLSKISGLFVIARNSAFSYKGQPANVERVARELGVRYILEGSVRRRNNRVRINAQLIDGATANHIWAERYERGTEDIFGIQDEVIQDIVKSLKVKLSGEEKAQVTRLPTSNLEAYDFYLRAEQFAYRADPASVSEALSLYEKSLALDPEFAEAHAGYGRAAIDALMFTFTDALPAAVARKSAYKAAGRALQLEPDQSRGYSSLALLQMLDGEHDAALASARKATSVNPNNAEAHLNLAVVMVYAGLQREALEMMRRVLQLDPKPPRHVHEYHALVLYMNRDYQGALDALNRVEDLAQSEFGMEALAMSHARLGNTDEARATNKRHLKRWPDQSISLYRIIYSHHARAEDLAHRLEGLRLSGMPNWPYAFEGDPARRLDGAAIEKLTFGRTWQGSLQIAGPFVQFVDSNGGVVERSTNRQIVGKVSRNGDLLCMQFPAFALSRTACGPVYRNFGSDFDYTYVNALGVKRFTPAP